MVKSKMCKRCGTYPRLDDPFHRGIGARSRVDNKTQICSDCGVDEAMADFFKEGLTPIKDWPVEKNLI